MVKKLWSLEVVKDKMDNHHLGRLNLASEGPLCQEDQKHHSSPSLFIRAAQLYFFNIGFPHKISFEERDLLKKKNKTTTTKNFKVTQLLDLYNYFQLWNSTVFNLVWGFLRNKATDWSILPKSEVAKKEFVKGMENVIRRGRWATFSRGPDAGALNPM